MRVWSQFGSTSKYSYNTEAFKATDSQEKAYWLGFLYADGAVSKNLDKFGLALAEKDKSHLEKYRDFIVPDRQLEHDHNNNAYRIFVSSKEITSDLVSKGCTPQKSLTLQPPPEGAIPVHLLRHFIRGYFDGDGCARMVKKDTRVSINFTGTEAILKFIVSYFKDNGLLCRAKIRKPKTYNAYVWENESVGDVKSIYYLLYKGSTIHLDRKKEIMGRVFTP